VEARVLPRAKKLVAAAKTLTVAGGKSATPTLTLRKKAKTQLARKGELALRGRSSCATPPVTRRRSA
jgi:hypothetical protein